MKMKIRNAIHYGINDISEIMTSGCNRSSMFAVQVVIIAKDYRDNKYKLIIGERTDKVAVNPLSYQFVPAGAFEIYGEENNLDDERIKDQCAVEYTIFREYLEEIFGVKEADIQQNGETLFNLLEHDIIKKLRNLIEKEDAFFEFLGSAFSFVDLRHLLLFVIRIDNIEYSTEIFAKIKTHPQRELIRVDPIKFSEFMNRDKTKLHPPSTALYKMLTENHLYKEIEKNDIN